MNRQTTETMFEKRYGRNPVKQNLEQQGVCQSFFLKLSDVSRERPRKNAALTVRSIHLPVTHARLCTCLELCEFLCELLHYLIAFVS